VRRSLLSLLALGPLVVALDWLDAAGKRLWCSAPRPSSSRSSRTRTPVRSRRSRPGLTVATALPALLLARGRMTQLGGAILLVAYAGLVVAFYYSGNR
jgi:hypothetical protein